MKKILCLFTALLLFVSCSYSSESEDFLNYVQCNYSDFAAFKVKKNYMDSINMSDTMKDREIAFKTLYADYIDYYRSIVRYYSERAGISFDYEYVKKYKNEYLHYGVGFNIPEGNWEVEEDYTMLLNTPDIPEVWSEWLKLQQKYVEKNRKTCEKSAKKGSGCEGGLMTIPETEQAIVDLGKIEKKSDIIRSIQSKDFDYIPYTSSELIDIYLMGNDLNPVFEWEGFDSRKLNKDSKKSFEHFIKHHKDSEYWGIVNEYYNKLKQNKFIYSSDINAWLVDELTIINQKKYYGKNFN